MKCWNCNGVLPAEEGEICPHCRAVRRPARGSRSELVGAAVTAAGAGIGYYMADWNGAAYGLSAGVPLGCIAAFLWARPPTVG